MKWKIFLSIISILISSLYAWEWESLEEDMEYEKAVEILGRPIEVDTDVSRIGDKKFEMAKARFKHKGFTIIATFSREHSGTELYGYTLYEYDISKIFTLSALKIIPSESKLSIDDIHNKFGNLQKTGRNGNLGLSEEYQDGAFVDYSASDDFTVISISWGYTHSDLY